MITLVLALLIYVAPGARAGPGATGAEFLKINPSPRLEALGGAFATETGDGSALIQNPAGIHGMATPEIGASHNRYLDGVDQSFLSVGFPRQYLNRKSRGTFGLGITQLRVAPFEGYDRFNVRTGEVTAADLAVSVAYADKIPSPELLSLNAGIAGKFITSRLDDATARATALDFGVIGLLNKEVPWITDVRGAISLQNIGADIKYGQDSGRLPRVYRLGLSAAPKRYDMLRVAIQRDKFLEEDARYSVGLESSFLTFLLARLGYYTGADEGNGLTFGMGIAPLARQIQIDYSFTQGDEFRSTHRFGVSYRFPRRRETDPMVEQLGEKIKTAIGKGELFYAREYLDRVRTLFPDHPLIEFYKPLGKKLEDDSAGRRDYVKAHQAFFRKEWKSAVESLELALKSESSSAELKEYLGLAKLEQDKALKIADLEKKARISVIFDLANNARLEGDSQKALRLLDEALRQAPYPPAAQLRKTIQEELKAQARAKPKAETAAPQAQPPKPSSLAVEQASALYYLAMQKYAEGDVRQAQQHLSQALSLDPSRKDISTTIDRIERELRRNKE